LDLGLRWEFYPPGTPHFAGGFSNYNPVTNSLVIAGVGQNSDDLGMVTRYKYFAPRTELAYWLTNSTVIRAGFGISFTPFPDNNYAYNYPIKQVNQFSPQSTQFLPAVLPNGQVATFQNGIPAPAPVSVPSNGIIPLAGTPVANNSLNYINLNFKNPTLSLGISRFSKFFEKPIRWTWRMWGTKARTRYPNRTLMPAKWSAPVRLDSRNTRVRQIPSNISKASRPCTMPCKSS
jgi:hypothetical protein